MKDRNKSDADCRDISMYSSDTNQIMGTPVSPHPARSMATLRREIMNLDRIDSICIRNRMDESYAELDIDRAMRWEKRLRRYNDELHNAVDSILDMEISLGLLQGKNLRWKGPAWLRIIRNEKMQGPPIWHEVIYGLTQQQQVWNLSKVIDYDASIDYAYNLRAIAYAEQDCYEAAMADFDTAININPAYAGYYINRGIARSLNDKDELALEDFNTAIAMDANFPEAYSARGILYICKEEFKLALFDFTRAIELDPTHAGHYNNRANIYGELDQNDLALLDYTKAIHLNPKSVTAFTNRGLTYYDAGNFKRAVKDFSKAIKLGRSSAEIYRKRADSYKQLGKYAESDQDILYALELEGKCYVDSPALIKRNNEEIEHD